MSHPSSCNDPACELSYRDHLTSIAISSASLPTRQKNADVAQTAIREKRWERDIAAFERLHKQGHTPPQIDGSRCRERHGQTEWDITTRPVNIDYSDPT